MFDIEKPIYLILLLLIPILYLANKKYLAWQYQKQQDFATQKAFVNIIKNHQPLKNKISFLLTLGIIFFTTIALINPKFGSEKSVVKTKGIEIVFALDVSKSMLCEDMKPNRLEKAKQIINKTIDDLALDRIGVIAYAANAFPVLPMTTDYSLAKMYVQSMDTNLISSQGTDIDGALQTSIDFFDNPNASKVIVLLSDGEDHESTNLSSITKAKDKNISVITIGLGTKNGGNIRYLDEYGEPQLKVDAEGKAVITKLVDDNLKEIASETNGKYIYSNSINDIVSTIKSTLNGYKKSDLKTQALSQKKSQFQWFIAIALILLVLKFAVDYHQFSEKKWIKNWFVILLLFNISFVSSQTPSSILQEKKWRVVKSKSESNKNKAQYNLGNNIYKNKNYIEAEDKYQSHISEAKNKKEKHKAYHNLGNVYMKEKKFDKAVEAYKNALRNNPNDEQTRYNLALAKQKLKQNPPPKKDKNKDKKENKDKKQDKNKDKKDQQKKDQKQEPNKDKKDNKKEQQKQNTNNILNAINNQEKKVQEKVNANKSKSSNVVKDKDW